MPQLATGLGEGLVGIGRVYEIGVAGLKSLEYGDNLFRFQLHEASQLDDLGRGADHGEGCELEIEIEHEHEHEGLERGVLRQRKKEGLKGVAHHYAVVEVLGTSESLHSAQACDVAPEQLRSVGVGLPDELQHDAVATLHALKLLVEKQGR